MYKNKKLSGEVIADIPELLLLYKTHEGLQTLSMGFIKEWSNPNLFQPAVFYIHGHLGNPSKKQSRHRNLYAK